MKVVQVTWEDAQGESGWKATGDIVHEPDRITSVGWLVKRDDVGVTICQSFNRDGRIADTLFVPAAYVRTVKTIK
jgi:hypothetical protein